MQRLGARGEPVDVVADGVVRQFVRPGRSGELRVEEDVLASPDELLVRLLELIEWDVPEAVNDLVREDQGVGGVMPGSGASPTASRATRPGWSAASA
jgi:hypothetical protein